VFSRALDRRGSDPSDPSRESTVSLSGLFMLAVLWAFGGIYIQPPLVSLGLDGMVL